jgi:hypothetical protein
MSKPPRIRLERLPKRDAVVRLRAAYACLERSWQVRRSADERQSQSASKQEKVS